MALKVEEAMDMSLDEYIAMSKKPKDVANKNVPNATLNDGKFGRRRSNMDDDEDEDLDLLSKEKELLEEETSSAVTNNDTGIWKGPDSSLAFLDCSSRQNDLRERINNSNNGRKQKISAIQYRLMAPNNSADRPRGLPTLLPLDAYVKQNNNGGYNNNRNHNRGRNRNYRNRGFNNNNGGFNNNNNNNKHFAGNCMGVVSNGRIQRNRNQDMSKNLRLTVNCNKSMATPQVNTPRNMFIECPSNTINLNPVSQFNSGFQRQSNQTQCDFGEKRMPVGNLTPQAQAALNLDSNANQSSSGNVDNLKDLLGFQGNLPGDMMPVFASRLIDLIKNNVQPTVHKPIYDMKIQKDIHEIQNKPLVYKCPGGDVVSSDGAGVNCQIIPRTSGISLNCRFA